MSRVMDEESRRIERAEGGGLGELVSDLLRHGVTLIQNELQLAKAELSAKRSQAGAGATSLVLAAIFGNAALIILLAAATLGLAELVEGWLAALIVGAAAAIVAFVFFAVGRNKLRTDRLAPRASVESLREDARVLGGHLR